MSDIRNPFPRWRAAVAAARNNVRPAKLLFFGDSNIAGEGAGTGTKGLVNARAGGMGPACIARLNTKVLKATASTLLGDNNVTISGGGLTNYNQFDSRVVLGTGWASDIGPSAIGGRFFVGTGPTTGDLTFAPTDACDTVQVFWVTHPGANPSINVKIDGTVVGTLNENAANAVQSTTYTTAPGNPAVHTIGFNATGSGNAYILGVATWSSVNPGIVGMVAGWCGARSLDLNADPSVPWTAYPWSPMNAIPNIAPDMTVVYCTINDGNGGTSAAQYQTNMDNIISKAVQTGDCLIVGGFPSGGVGTTNGALDSYMPILRQLAIKYGASCVDLRQMLGATFTEANNYGYTFDQDHPNLGAHGLIGNWIADLIYTP